MAENDALWDIERGFWMKGENHYRLHLHDDCAFAFPEPTGLMQGANFINGMGEYSPWASVKFHSETITRPTDNIAVLSYRAVGSRHDGDPYEAFCTTTYVLRADDTPRLIQHQQTPVES